MQQSITRPSIARQIITFYRDGFRDMTLGRTLWKVIIIKLLIIFAVLRLFFFPDFLNTNFTTDRERADYVLEQITTPPATIPTNGGTNGRKP